MFAKFPVTPLAQCPSVKEVHTLLSADPNFLDLAANKQPTLAKCLNSRWRENQFKVRANHFWQTYSKLNMSKVKDLPKYIARNFPNCQQPSKIAGYAKGLYKSPSKRCSPDVVHVDNVDKIIDLTKSQKWPVVIRTGLPGRGRGVFTSSAIPKGAVVIDYGGVYLTRREGDHRYDNTDQFHGYLFFFKLNEKTHYRDATEDDGHLGSLINHSPCCGNLKAKPIDLFHDGYPHIIFLANKDIPIDTELLFDYNDTDSTIPFLQDCPQCKHSDQFKNFGEVDPLTPQTKRRLELTSPPQKRRKRLDH